MKKNDSAPPSTTADTPTPAIPPGTDADVTVKYRTRVDPNQSARERERELQDLASYANDLDTETLPLDELGTFCAVWANYGGYNLNIVRLPDPPERRLIGQTYARPCFNLEQLGSTSFDPTNLIASLQYFNQGSGGVFRLWLTDHDGTMIPGAHVQRVAIADPPRGANGTPMLQQSAQQMQQFQAPPPPPPREKSEGERKLEETKDRLFNSALERALNPPQQQTPTLSGTAGLPAEDQAALLILNQSGFIPTVFTKLTEMAQQVAQAGAQKEPSWKERGIDAALELATKNPAIVERLGGVLERIVARVLPDPKLDGPRPQSLFQSPSPWNTTAPSQPTTQEAQLLPEAPNPDDDLGDDDDMDIIDRLTALLNSDTPLTLSDPLFKELGAAYPIKFRFAVKMIIANELDVIVKWIKLTGGPPYVIMLEGHGGEYIVKRLAELQQLIIEAEKAKKNASQTQQAESAQTDSQGETDSTQIPKG